MRNQKIAIVLGATALFFSGCAKETMAVGPAPAGEQATADAVADDSATDSPTLTTEETVEAVTGAPSEELSDDNGAVSAARSETLVVTRTGDADVERSESGVLPQDSVAYEYLIRPDDYLTKIAFKEYGNPNEWRKIYQWNLERIGSDPTHIMPFHGLDLYKPADQIVATDFDYTTHTVDSGENLWSIAGKEYDDSRAWIVIFWDNDELLASTDGLLKPGMELRIRTKLW